MPMPFAPRISLSQNARSDLHSLIRAHSTPQSLALRSRMVLRAADADQPSNLKSAMSWAVITTPLANALGLGLKVFVMAIQPILTFVRLEIDLLQDTPDA